MLLGSLSLHDNLEGEQHYYQVHRWGREARNSPFCETLKKSRGNVSLHTVVPGAGFTHIPLRTWLHHREIAIIPSFLEFSDTAQWPGINSGISN